MRDLFDEPAPASRPVEKIDTPPARPRRQSATRSGAAEAEAKALSGEARMKAPCARPWNGRLGHPCSVGGGDAVCSMDGGRTWQCADHVDPAFWPKNR